MQNRKQNLSNLCAYPLCLQSGKIPETCRERLTVRPAEIPVCIHIHQNQLLLLQMRAAAEFFAGDLVKAYLMLEISSRHPQAQRLYHQQQQEFPFCNIHSLSTASGYPRETVRRKVHQMIDDGLISRLPDGGLLISEKAVALWEADEASRQTVMLLQIADKISALQALQAGLPAVAD